MMEFYTQKQMQNVPRIILIPVRVPISSHFCKVSKPQAVRLQQRLGLAFASGGGRTGHAGLAGAGPCVQAGA